MIECLVPELLIWSVCLHSHLFRMQVYHLFGWFWIMNFIIALGQCVQAGAFASYYWAWDKKHVGAILKHNESLLSFIILYCN